MSTPGIALGRRMQGCALVAGVEFTSTAMLGRRWQPGPGSWGVVHGRSAETIAVQWKTLPQLAIELRVRVREPWLISDCPVTMTTRIGSPRPI